MRDIYLIDFENVASEGLSGITYLAPEDEVIIFYSNNSNRLSMKMHILIGKSVCKCNYFEVTVGGKNALDHQISTWLGYLIGTRAAERNYYIVSKDMGYKFVASFWTESAMKPSVRCIDSIRAANRGERSRQLRAPKTEEAQPLQLDAVEPVAELTQPEPMVELAAPEPVLRLQEPAETPAEVEVREETAQEPEISVEPQTEVVPELDSEPEPEPPKVAHRRSFFGVVLPDWPEKKAEPAPVEQTQPVIPEQETPTVPEPEEIPEETVIEPEPEEQPVPQAESGGEWPPLEDEPHEGDAPPSRSRSRSRSRRGRTRSGHGTAKEPVESSEGKDTAKSEKKLEKKSEPKPEKKTEPKPEKKTEKKPDRKPEKKAEP